MRPHLATAEERDFDEEDDDDDDSADDDDIFEKTRVRLQELHREADRVAVDYVRSRLTPEERAALDSRLPSTLARTQRRKEIEAELALTLPKLKAHLKAATKRSLKDYSSYLGDVVTPEDLQAALKAKFAQIDALTAEDQARGQASLREELAELDAEQAE
jgi:hypothetical protein